MSSNRVSIGQRQTCLPESSPGATADHRHYGHATATAASSGRGERIETAAFIGSTISHCNADEGTSRGPKSTVTGNTTNDNGDTGVRVECPGTVTNNKSSGNGVENYEFEGTGCFQKNNT